MIKLEYLGNRYIQEKTIQFNQAVELIKMAFSNDIKDIKTIFEISCIKGIGLHTVSIWNKDDIEFDIYNNNFIISDNKNSISINENSNFIIKDRYKNCYCFEIYFNDYNMSFVINNN